MRCIISKLATSGICVPPSKGCLRFKNNSAIRSLATLREKHKIFLGLVGEHGSGSVKLTYDNKKHIAILSLANEPARNAISGKMMVQLADALDELIDDGSKRYAELHGNKAANIIGLILRSPGKAFCSGADLNLVADIVNTPELGMSMAQFMTDAFTRLRSSGLISVCLINGSCIGGGAELATVCDFRLMSDSKEAYISFVHASKGASPGWGGGSRLVNIIGRQHALQLLATSLKISPKKGLEIGLIDLIASEEDICTEEGDNKNYDNLLRKMGEEYLLPYTSMPFPKSVSGIKVLVGSFEYLSKKHSSEIEMKLFGERWGSKDQKHGFSSENKIQK